MGAIVGGIIAARYGLDAPFLLSVVLGVLAVVLWWASSAKAEPLHPGPA
ncbi:hypothetical protein ACFQ3B_08780 [Stackebrandtia endophytica]|nr:hypothetical protein [Stackebrandtia endophytica]